MSKGNKYSRSGNIVVVAMNYDVTDERRNCSLIFVTANKLRFFLYHLSFSYYTTSTATSTTSSSTTTKRSKDQ